MHRRRHRTRITFPSTTPVAWDQELGLPCQEVPGTAGSWGAPRMEGGPPRGRPTGQVGWWARRSTRQGRAGAKHSPGEPPAVRPSGRTHQGWRAETRPPPPGSHLPVRDGRDGSRRVSAHSRQQLLQVLGRPGHPAGQLRHHLAERGQGQGSSWGARVQPVLPAVRRDPGASGTRPQRGRADGCQPTGCRGLRKCPPIPSTLLAASCRRFPLE